MISRKNSTPAKLLAMTIGLGLTVAISGCSETVEVPTSDAEKQAQLSRIRPVVTLDDLKTPKAAEPAPAPAAAPTPAAAAEPAAAPAATASVKPMYDKACMACHTTGAAGAPMLGDQAAWESRLSAAGGIDGLVTSAKTGKGAMPPNGASTYSEAEMRQVIEFILAESGLN